LIYLNIGCLYNTLALELNIRNLCFVCLACVADRKALQIHDDFRNVFLNARNGAEFVQNTFNLNLAYSGTRKRGKHDSSQGIAQCDSVSSFQRFYNKFAVFLIFRNLCNFNFRFVKIKHYMVPSLWVNRFEG